MSRRWPCGPPLCLWLDYAARRRAWWLTAQWDLAFDDSIIFAVIPDAGGPDLPFRVLRYQVAAQ